jgi:hypothetical protein
VPIAGRAEGSIRVIDGTLGRVTVGPDEPGGATVDPDDWFAGTGSDSLDETRERASGDAPSHDHTAASVREAAWLDGAGETEGAPPPAARWANAPRRWLAAVVGGAIVLILIVLAASGVFSSNGNSGGSAPTTTSRATTPPPAAHTPSNPTPAPTPTPTPTPTVTLPGGVLKPGTSGSEVKTLQRALASAGYAPGSIDGIYGTNTEQAITGFQRSVGITADGIYGPQTKQALQQKLNSG